MFDHVFESADQNADLRIVFHAEIGVDDGSPYAHRTEDCDRLICWHLSQSLGNLIRPNMQHGYVIRKGQRSVRICNTVMSFERGSDNLSTSSSERMSNGTPSGCENSSSAEILRCPEPKKSNVIPESSVSKECSSSVAARIMLLLRRNYPCNSAAETNSRAWA